MACTASTRPCTLEAGISKSPLGYTMNCSGVGRVFVTWSFLALTPGWGAEPPHAPLVMSNPMQDKNFYVLSVIERTPAARAQIQSNDVLNKLAAAKRAALMESVRTCVNDVPCYAKAMRWTDQEIASSRVALGQLAAADGAVRKLVDGPVRQSGLYQRYSTKTSAEVLEQAWEDAARKMNIGIDIFALGEKPPHQFDGPAYDVKSPEFGRTMLMLSAVVNNESKPTDLFFQPSLRFIMELLHAQLRDEAGRHEPLEVGENLAAVRRVQRINWEQYPYTSILVLGQGPDREGVALAPGGRLRLLPAVKAFREGKAPVVIVSGGYVHPPLTPYNEAIEMKKVLMAEFGIPEDSILVDPHARITITNIRNANRLIYRNGIPFDRKALVVSSPSHIDSVQKATMRDNLGYMPYRTGTRISPFELEFVPQLDSLNTDLVDLMDP